MITMCGRYTLFTTAGALAKRFGLGKVPTHIPENYNVAPGALMPVIVLNDAGERQIELMRWGLIPPWAKDPHIGYKLINARDDSIFDRPVWRSVILHKRALVPANGFYEWKRPSSPKERKQPFYIRPKQQELFAFAGVWETWRDADGNEVKTFAIITTEPNKEMADVHNRMPVIVEPEDEASWLEPSKVSRNEIEPFLHPYEDDGLELIMVSSDVNVTRNNDKKLIYPINSQ